MRLEDAYHAFAGIEEPDSLDGGGNLIGMMCIVVDVDEVFLTDTVVEAAAHAGEGFQTMAQLILVEAATEGYRRGDHGILDIDKWCAVEFEVEEHTVGGAEVEEEVAIIVADIDGIVVGLDAACGIGLNVWMCECMGVGMVVVVVVVVVMVVVVLVAVFGKFLAVGGTEDALLEEETSVGVGLVGELEISLHHGLMGTIDIQMVGVGGSDNGHVRMKLEEGAIILVGLDDDIVAIVVHEEVAIEVFADTAQEGIAPTRSL